LSCFQEIQRTCIHSYKNNKMIVNTLIDNPTLVPIEYTANWFTELQP